MDIWIKAAQLFLSLAILVTLHELGHFIPAKLFKTRIEKFYLFFNPWVSLFRYKRVNGKKKYSWFSKTSPEEWSEDPDTTEWGIGWLPLGGYVKISGMIDESMDKEQMEKPAEPWEFRSKPAWQRLIIMIGGVTVNLILGMFIYIMVLFTWGQTHINPEKMSHGASIHPYLGEKYGLFSGDKILAVDGEKIENLDELNKIIMLRDISTITVRHQNGKTETISLPEDIGSELFQAGAFPVFALRMKMASVANVTKGSGAAKAGIKPEDILYSVNNQKVTYFDEFQKSLYDSKGKTVEVGVLRKTAAGPTETLSLKTKVDGEGKIGFEVAMGAIEDSSAIEKKSYSFGESVSRGTSYGLNTLTDYVAQFKFIFTKKGAGSIGGFAAIGNMFPPAWDWQAFWLNTALLSIILAFMNILPIPALDGGHVVFLIYEMVTGKEAPQKVLEVAQYIGIFLLLGLMIYANGNDLIRWINGAF
ncbi:RIP metalloprotease RseP [Crocinitomicaceae bacterium]|nr:RIP metalloprotease RseP [Crocinitomicaceae bacterium]